MGVSRNCDYVWWFSDTLWPVNAKKVVMRYFFREVHTDLLSAIKRLCHINNHKDGSNVLINIRLLLIMNRINWRLEVLLSHPAILTVSFMFFFCSSVLENIAFTGIFPLIKHVACLYSIKSIARSQNNDMFAAIK